jgi:hypothetical protein
MQATLARVGLACSLELNFNAPGTKKDINIFIISRLHGIIETEGRARSERDWATCRFDPLSRDIGIDKWSNRVCSRMTG